MTDRASEIERIGSADGMVVIRDRDRRFPGVLIQGDTMRSLLDDLEEEAPLSTACQTVRGWVAAYETVMASRAWELPYS